MLGWGHWRLDIQENPQLYILKDGSLMEENKQSKLDIWLCKEKIEETEREEQRCKKWREGSIWPKDERKQER